LKAISLPTIAAAAAAAGALAAPGTASAHAHVSPSTVVARSDNLFALTVPTEKEGVQTTTIELTPPEGFELDAFAPSPGWKRDVETSGSGAEARISKVTWSGGHVPTDASAFLQFVGGGESSASYDFEVRQTYSDGSVVDWNGPESSDTPAPVVEATSSLGSGGGSTLAIVALVVAAAGVLLAALALLSRGGARPLA
jgi:uncharacterized protein YcnI